MSGEWITSSLSYRLFLRRYHPSPKWITITKLQLQDKCIQSTEKISSPSRTEKHASLQVCVGIWPTRTGVPFKHFDSCQGNKSCPATCIARAGNFPWRKMPDFWLVEMNDRSLKTSKDDIFSQNLPRALCRRFLMPIGVSFWPLSITSDLKSRPLFAPGD